MFHAFRILLFSIIWLACFEKDGLTCFHASWCRYLKNYWISQFQILDLIFPSFGLFIISRPFWKHLVLDIFYSFFQVIFWCRYNLIRVHFKIVPPWAMVQFQLHSNVLVAACMFFFHLHLNLHFRIFTFILFLDFLQLQLDNNDFSCTGCSLSPYFQLLFHPSELFQENHPHSQMHFHKNGIFRAWSWKMYTNCNTIICNIEFAPTIWEEDWEICFSQRFLQMWINFILQSNSWMKEAEGKSYHIIPSWCKERAKKTQIFFWNVHRCKWLVYFQSCVYNQWKAGNLQWMKY